MHIRETEQHWQEIVYGSLRNLWVSSAFILLSNFNPYSNEHKMLWKKYFINYYNQRNVLN